MQDNIAYNTVELSSVAPCENVYETPCALKMDQKQIEPRFCNSKRRIKARCFGLASVFAIALAALAVVLSLVQLTNNYSSQQWEIELCKSSVQQLQETSNNMIDMLRLEVSSVQENISKLLSMSSTDEPATTVALHSKSCVGPGWRRVAFINMTDPNQDCPQGLSLTDYSIRSCGRGYTGPYICSSVIFPVDGLRYSQVCGRATAYRWGINAGFYGYNLGGQTIDGYYVYGLSLTHGSPRTHIWTFVSSEFSGTSGDDFAHERCPCDPGNTYGPPSFIGNNYFCDSVATADNWRVPTRFRFFPDNALWDGQDHLNVCYGFNNPPWFNTTLPVPTTDNIELRMCFGSPDRHSNIAIELLEIYVQ